MKHRRILPLVLIIALLFSLCIPAVAEDDRTITVSGSATISLLADTATIEIGVETTSQDVAEAQQQNTYEMNRVIEALKKAGVSEEDLITSNFNVWSGYEYAYSSLGEEERIPTYTVNNMLNVTVRDLSTIGNLIDVAVSAGANQMYGLSFSSSESNDAYQKALARAVEDAKAKATTLCSAAGADLGVLLHIDAVDNGYNYGIRNVYSAKAEDAAGTSIISGDVQVSATVTLTYEIK